MLELIEQIISTNISLGPVIFIILKVIAIAIPPIPGLPLDLVAISLFGKVAAFIYATISIMIGASIGFFIARYFREPAVKRFIALEKIQEWEEKMSEQEGVSKLILFRFWTNPVFDYLSYVAGLSKMSYPKFFMISLLGMLPGLTMFYYFAGLFLENQFYFALIIGVVISIPTYFVTRSERFKTTFGYFKNTTVNRINNIKRMVIEEK